MGRMTSRSGERMSETAPVYIKHPVAGGNWVRDADFMDAGTAHILASDIAHLAEESVRPIGWTLGPGALERYQNGTWTTTCVIGNRTYTDVPFQDATAYSFPFGDAHTLIAWDHRVSHCLGPYVAIQDRALDAGGYGPRAVRVDVRCDVPGSAGLALVAALTASPDPPDQGSIAVAVGAGTPTAVASLAATGLQTVSMTLSAVDPVPEAATWSCRSTGAYGKTLVTVAPLWLWVGWYSGNATASAVISVSAYEVR